MTDAITMEIFFIKHENGLYLTPLLSWSSDIAEAVSYNSKRSAERTIRVLGLLDCKVA